MVGGGGGEKAVDITRSLKNQIVEQRQGGCSPGTFDDLGQGQFRIHLKPRAQNNGMVCTVNPDLTENNFPELAGLTSRTMLKKATLEYTLFVPRNFKTEEGIKLPGLSGTTGKSRKAGDCTGMSNSLSLGLSLTHM